MNLNSISVILPNFNHAKFLTLAIDKLLEQEKYIYELIIIDDCSNDISREIINKYAKLYPIIKTIFNKKNIGVVKTQNLGIRLAKGKFLYFAAADDFILPKFFELALSKFSINPACGIVCGDAVLINKKNEFLDIRPRMSPSLKFKYFNPIETKSLFNKIDNFILTGSGIIRKDLVNHYHNLDETLNAFSDGFMTREIAMSHGFIYIAETVSVWRFYDDSFSKSLTLNATKFNKFKKIYLNKILNNKNFDVSFFYKSSKRLNFQQKLTELHFKNLNAHFLKKIYLIIYRFFIFIKLRPISFANAITSIFFYLIKKYFYKKKYVTYKNKFLKKYTYD